MKQYKLSQIMAFLLFFPLTFCLEQFIDGDVDGARGLPVAWGDIAGPCSLLHAPSQTRQEVLGANQTRVPFQSFHG